MPKSSTPNEEEEYNSRKNRKKFSVAVRSGKMNVQQVGGDLMPHCMHRYWQLLSTIIIADVVELNCALHKHLDTFDQLSSSQPTEGPLSASVNFIRTDCLVRFINMKPSQYESPSPNSPRRCDQVKQLRQTNSPHFIIIMTYCGTFRMKNVVLFVPWWNTLADDSLSYKHY